MFFLNIATDYVKFNISIQKHSSPAQFIWLSINDAIFLLPVPRKPSPNLHGLNLWGNVLFNIANDYVKFNISLQKHLSPGTIDLTIYKRRHISASGSVQTVARPARLKPLGRCSFWIAQYTTWNSAFHRRNSHLRSQFIWLTTNDAIFLLPVLFSYGGRPKRCALKSLKLSY